ncbi:MAG: fumarylacetoacetate hydrolase family protein [Candidatus Omnitrophota bacterium]
MRIGRFTYKKKILWGTIEDDCVRPLADEPFKRIRSSSRKIPLTQIKLLAPATPSKIILVGLNYRNHAQELNMPIPQEPVIFLKPPTAVIANGGIIRYPQQVRRLDYEAELALIIKKEAKNISPSRAKDYILGFTCVNDVTARDLQHKDIQWSRAKSFDTFCPVGPWIETELDPRRLRIATYLNDSLKQDSSTANMIFPVDFVLSFVSSIMTLHAGDIISTGTPPGIGPMKRGDTVTVEIEHLGRLTNYIQ